MPRPAEAARAPADYAAGGWAAYSVPRIAALGGGTGLPILPRGLRKALRPARPGAAALRDRLTAIVTVADDGGSSGRLRRNYGVLPPGDVRNCLVALSDGQGALAALFGHRFNGHGEIAGHSPGNLILTALRPEHVPALPEALEAVTAADCVVIGPGKLARAVLEAAAKRRQTGELRA
jgi:2-phospho-L-lactate transferase/gluconeogenesis factor (CofD/UPF0052 family)